MKRMMSSLPGRRWRVAGGGLALALAVSGGAAFAISSSAASTNTPPSEQIIVCESGATTHNGIDTSAASATRVSAGTPIPPGCHLG